MKTLLISKLIFLTAIFSMAQNPIVPLLNTNDYFFSAGAYHKDVNNDMNKFVGEWLWQDGNNSLMLKFGKEVMIERFLPSRGYTIFEDLLYGEYRYVENGVEKINTLPLFVVLEGRQHNISGFDLRGTNHMPPCTDCAVDEVRIILFFRDPERDYIKSSILLRHGVQWWNQQEYIIAHLYTQWSPAGSEFKVNTIPSGTYTLYKQ